MNREDRKHKKPSNLFVSKDKRFLRLSETYGSDNEEEEEEEKEEKVSFAFEKEKETFDFKSISKEITEISYTDKKILSFIMAAGLNPNFAFPDEGYLLSYIYI